MDSVKNWKTKTILLGALLGASAGIIGAYIFIQRNVQTEDQPKLTAGEGVKLGLGLLGVLKLVSEISEKK